MNRKRTAILIAFLFHSAFQTGFAPCIESHRLKNLLARTGKYVEHFWEEVPSYSCIETVTQEKIGSKGKTEYRQESVFDYLAIPKASGEELVIEEMRLPVQPLVETQKRTIPPLLKSNGFPTLLLIFHLAYQDNHSFRLIDEPAGTGAGRLVRVGFEQGVGRHSTAALVSGQSAHALELKGTAWIDEPTGVIHRISASLISPMRDINLEHFAVDVSYEPPPDGAEADSIWVPCMVQVSLETAQQKWRNTHLYSHYKRFTVISSEAVGK